MASHRARCGDCRRSPLTGELMHELPSGDILCSLCLAELPEERRAEVRSERIHAAERHLSVVPRAA